MPQVRLGTDHFSLFRARFPKTPFCFRGALFVVRFRENPSGLGPKK
jgi:hypothetical protein